MRGASLLKALGVCALGLATALPGHGAGFGIFEQGTKAMGMAGAFTAQADDPSALFHNAGGLAFVTETDLQAGATYIRGTEAEFRGAAPFPGPNARGEQEPLGEILPHAYWVTPINDTWKFGLGLYAPFGLTTEWKNPDQFSGRFFSTKAALRAVDLNPTIGWQVTPNFGIGVGAIGRISDVELNRNVGAVNPFTQTVADVGRLSLEGDFSEGYGWNAGILHRFNNSFSWGLSYRSRIEIDYEGDARLTQIPTGNAVFDALLRTRLPYGVDLPVETAIEFPDMASLGLAFALSPNLLLETDVNWTGWSSFDSVELDFVGGATNSLPDSEIPQGWDDVNNYRAGLRWTVSPATQLRFGYVYDESPQPEESVSPLLPDADRNGITIGYGYTGGAFTADFALMYLDFKERERFRSFAGESDFFGTYNTKAILVGATIGF
jgi:long-chain fatty acid transport protein